MTLKGGLLRWLETSRAGLEQAGLLPLSALENIDFTQRNRNKVYSTDGGRLLDMPKFFCFKGEISRFLDIQLEKRSLIICRNSGEKTSPAEKSDLIILHEQCQHHKG